MTNLFYKFDNEPLNNMYNFLKAYYQGDEYYSDTLILFIDEYNLSQNSFFSILKYLKEGDFLNEYDLRLVITYYLEIGLKDITPDVYDFYHIIDFLKAHKILNDQYKELLINIKDLFNDNNLNIYKNFIDSYNMYEGNTQLMEDYLIRLYDVKAICK